MYKKAGCRCKVVVLLIETYWFFDVLASVAVVVAKKLLLAHVQSARTRYIGLRDISTCFIPGVLEAANRDGIFTEKNQS